MQQAQATYRTIGWAQGMALALLLAGGAMLALNAPAGGAPLFVPPHPLIARAAVAGTALLGMVAAWRLGRVSSARHSLVALVVAGFWAESARFSALLLPESVSAVFCLAGAGALLAPGRSDRQVVVAGALLGMAVLADAPRLVLAGTLILFASLRGDADVRRLMGGFGAAIAVMAVADIARGHLPLGPFAWHALAPFFSTTPPMPEGWGVLDYARQFLEHFGSPAPLIGVLAVAAGGQYRPLQLAILTDLGIRSLLADKAFALIWPDALAVLVLAGIGSVRVLDQLAATRIHEPRPGRIAMGLLCMVWVALGWVAPGAAGG